MEASQEETRRTVSEALALVAEHLTDPIVADAFRRTVRDVDLRELPSDEGDPLLRAIERLSQAQITQVGQKLMEIGVLLDRAATASRSDLNGANVNTGAFSVRASELLPRLAEIGGRSWEPEHFRRDSCRL